MSEPKFTPRPWALHRSTLEPGFWNIGNETRMYDIARVEIKWAPTPSQAEANARLIAAAPDMYAVLKSTRFYISELLKAIGPDAQGLQQTLDELDAALAKAGLQSETTDECPDCGTPDCQVNH